MSETMQVGGPLFEQRKSGVWESLFQKDGAHYNHFSCRDKDGMKGLRDMFPDGIANDLNFVLFSTSGVHGMYTTIEKAEKGVWDDGEEMDPPQVTFLIVHPRICCLRHGNCEPETADDFAFLKRLRESSWEAVQTIGRHES